MSRMLLPSFVWAHLNTKLHLSPREAEIVQRLSLDESEDSIGHQLGISRHTVHSHLERLYRKLDVTSRTQVVIRLFQEYITQVPPSEASFRPPSVVSRDSTGPPRRRLFQRVPRDQLAGIMSVHFGGRDCDDLLIDLGPGGLRLRATHAVPPSEILKGATILRPTRRARPVRVPVAHIESNQCVVGGANLLAHRAIFSRVLPASLCSDLQGALGNGAAGAGAGHLGN